MTGGERSWRIHLLLAQRDERPAGGRQVRHAGDWGAIQLPHKPQVERTSRKLYNNEQIPQLITANDPMRKIGLR